MYVKTISRNRFIASLILLIILVTAYWAYHKRGKNDSTVRKVTIAQYGDVFLYAPLYIAKDAGLFAKRGLDVSLVSTGGDEKTWAAVTSGSASFGVADPTFVAISDSRGQPGRVIASIVNGVPFWGVTFKQDIAPFSSSKSLTGLTVATFPAPSTAYTLQKKMFIQAGLQPSIREGAFGTLLTMLRTGQADIALELEPNVSQAESDGAHVVYSMGDSYGEFAMTGLTTTPDLLARQPDLARDVVCSLQMANDYIRMHPDSSLDILAARFPEVKRDVAKGALSRMVAGGIVPKSVVLQPSAWDKAIALRVESGDLSNPKSSDSYLDEQYAKWAEQNCHLN